MSSQPTPLFSIVIPTFNRRALVLEAIQSVLTQDCHDYEIIVIDDGSTDGTTEAVTSLDPSIRVISHSRNMKRGIARNRGIDESRGTFIVFLDDDDLFESNHLSRFEAAARPGSTLAFSSGAVFWDADTGRSRPFVRSRMAIENLNQATLLGTVLPLPSLCVAREALSGFEAFPEAEEVDGSEDFVFLARLASSTDIKLLDDPTLRIREHAGRGMKKLEEIIRSRKAAMKLLLEEGLPAGPLQAWERQLLIAGTARFSAALYYEGLRIREARAELRSLRNAVGLRKALELGGRLWLQSLLGAPGVRLARSVRNAYRKMVHAEQGGFRARS